MALGGAWWDRCCESVLEQSSGAQWGLWLELLQTWWCLTAWDEHRGQKWRSMGLQWGLQITAKLATSTRPFNGPTKGWGQLTSALRHDGENLVPRATTPNCFQTLHAAETGEDGCKRGLKLERGGTGMAPIHHGVAPTVTHTAQRWHPSALQEAA